MKKMIFIALILGLASVAQAGGGGVYSKCDGMEWSSAPQNGSYGRVCIHCNNGKQIRLHSEYIKGGSEQRFYFLDGRYAGQGPHTGSTIKSVCR
ncbi:MAG: hypothetical protein BA874_10600 [Desulfuromonadales bacterium C00003068]|jgi:hypothetical protein|nr:hypothetical protein [Deltaproteobacteria bacterium]OEU72646.1 MAG: hypothetical protein BA874_10600 [Desulfuromonadales bacterium C00003068]